MEIDDTFEGFEPANTTPIPDVYIDEIMPTLSHVENNVMMYIMRRTYGFKKQVDGISLNQFEHGITTRDGRQLDKGVGFKRVAICRALKSLEKRGYVISWTKNEWQSKLRSNLIAKREERCSICLKR